MTATRTAIMLNRMRTMMREAFSDEQPLRREGFNLALCFSAALLISFQQIAYQFPGYPLNRARYAIRAATGLKTPWIYSYGLYYWGLFPVYSADLFVLDSPDKYSSAFAREILKERGDSLWMEYNHEIRFGDIASICCPI